MASAARPRLQPRRHQRGRPAGRGRARARPRRRSTAACRREDRERHDEAGGEQRGSVRTADDDLDALRRPKHDVGPCRGGDAPLSSSEGPLARRCAPPHGCHRRDERRIARRVGVGARAGAGACPIGKKVPQWMGTTRRGCSMRGHARPRRRGRDDRSPAWGPSPRPAATRRRGRGDVRHLVEEVGVPAKYARHPSVSI